jgi:hypothetical protein
MARKMRLARVMLALAARTDGVAIVPNDMDVIPVSSPNQQFMARTGASGNVM